MNAIGRPRKDGLDRVIKVTVSENIAEMLEETSKEVGKTKSEMLRDMIPIISSKDFEGMLSNTNMEILQKYSEKCWETLHTQGCIFEVDKISKIMPAFLMTWNNSPLVYVKYPTYTIQIFDGKNVTKKTDQLRLEKLLDNIVDRSMVRLSKTNFFVAEGQIESLTFPYVNQVTCLGIGLNKNIALKNDIIETLNDNGYVTSVIPAYYIRGIKVELLEDDKYFKVI